MSGWMTRLALAALLAGVSGCVVELSNDDDGGDGGGGGDSGGETLRIVLVNESGVTLDPQLFLSASPVSTEELFADGNKFTRFGVGTLGLLGADSSDEFEVSCADARVIGTRGGTFGNDLNNPDGAGRQIVLTQDLSVFCGGTVVFTFSASGDTFSTTFDVNP